MKDTKIIKHVKKNNKKLITEKIIQTQMILKKKTKKKRLKNEKKNKIIKNNVKKNNKKRKKKQKPQRNGLRAGDLPMGTFLRSTIWSPLRYLTSTRMEAAYVMSRRRHCRGGREGVYHGLGCCEEGLW